jgi:hypothetical protein
MGDTPSDSVSGGIKGKLVGVNAGGSYRSGGYCKPFNLRYAD